MLFSHQKIYTIMLMQCVELKAYLCTKTKANPSFYYEFDVDEESQLANLFWVDSTSKLDYLCFRNVLTFDTTY